MEQERPKAEDEAVLRGLYLQLIDGWNRGDGHAFAAAYSEDADHVGFEGTHLKGRTEIAAQHQQLFDTYVKGSRLVGKVRSIRLLTPDVALMHAVGGTIMAGEDDLSPDRNSVHTLVAVKQHGEWRLAAFHNTRAEYWGRPEAVNALTEELRNLL